VSFSLAFGNLGINSLVHVLVFVVWGTRILVICVVCFGGSRILIMVCRCLNMFFLAHHV